MMPTADETVVAELGRGPGHPSGSPRLRPQRQRPGPQEPTHPLGLRGVSRSQLQLRASGTDGLWVDNVGRCALLINGVVQREATVGPGDVLELRQQIAWLCIRRPVSLPSPQDFPMARALRFGHADALHLVGESPAMWALREDIASVAAHPGHVLVTGRRGTGNKLAVRGIHVLSPRGRNRLVHYTARHSADLVDPELFGTARDQPEPGAKERQGLLGSADGGTLLVEDIDQLPAASRERLQQTLDDGGDYRRIGETQPRHSDLRLVASSHRDVEDIEPELAARLPARVRVPSLHERREDIPLLARHLLVELARGDATLRQRFFDVPDDASPPRPRLDPALVTALVRHEYSTNIEELMTLLKSAIASSPGDRIMLTPSVEVSAP